MKERVPLTARDIYESYEEAAANKVYPVRCKECGIFFYTFFMEHNARYNRFMSGEDLHCIDHTPTDLILENLKRPQN